MRAVCWLATTVGVTVSVTGAPATTPRWTVQTSGVTTRLRGVSAVSDNVAWASGANGTIVRTQDGGRSWQRLDVPDATALDFRDIDAIDDRTAYVLSIGTGDASRIYKTFDAGARWTLQFTNRDPEAFFDGMAFWDAERGVAVSDSVNGHFVIIRTDNGGRTWTPVPADALPPALPGEGSFAASGTTFVSSGAITSGSEPAPRTPHVSCARGMQADRGASRRRRWLRDRPPASSPSRSAIP
jgi:photosystem II stability/assembly factor-like uncharacterized protein